MALGPELIKLQASDITRGFARNKVRRAASRDCWLSVSFSRDRALLFSWDPEFYGVCAVYPDEIRELEGSSPARPPLLDAVKSHIAGAELEDAEQINADRVLKLRFRRVIGAGFFETRFLIAEACGRYSNVILTDGDENIIEAAKHIYPESNRYRNIIPGHRYAAPPVIGGVTAEGFGARSVRAADEIENIRGIGKPLIGELKKLCATEEGRRTLPDAFDFYASRAGDPVYQFLNGGKYVTAAPFVLPSARKSVAADSLAAARAVTVVPILGRGIAAYRKKIAARLGVLDRANEKRIFEYEALRGGADEIERLKGDGQLILANAYKIPRRAESATLTEWTPEGPVERNIKLDGAKDAAANAEALFAKYRRKKAALAAAERVLPELYAKRREINEQRVMAECCDDRGALALTLAEITRDAGRGRDTGNGKKSPRAEQIPPHKRIEFASRGAVIFCGLSAKGNRYVTFRLAKGDDFWFHAQGVPGAHVILRFNAKPGRDDFSLMAEAAASCAAYHSGGRTSGRVRVDYAERKHVRAIQGEGPADVTYKEFKTISADPSNWPALESEAKNFSAPLE